MAFRRKRTDSTLARPPRGEAPEDRPPTSLIDKEKGREKVFAAALRLLSARPRSEKELREKLLAKSWLDPAQIDECIARLKELGYVNDRAYAENYVRSRLQVKAIGKARLARELAGKKIGRELIEETLDTVFADVVEDDVIDQAIEKHVRLHGRPRDPKGTKKLLAYLMRRGFAYESIAKKLRALRLAIEEEE